RASTRTARRSLSHHVTPRPQYATGSRSSRANGDRVKTALPPPPTIRCGVTGVPVSSAAIRCAPRPITGDAYELRPAAASPRVDDTATTGPVRRRTAQPVAPVPATGASSPRMLTFSHDPDVAEQQMNAIIFYLTAFGYIDGEFDLTEKTFVKIYIRQLVNDRAK